MGSNGRSGTATARWRPAGPFTKGGMGNVRSGRRTRWLRGQRLWPLALLVAVPGEPAVAADSKAGVAPESLLEAALSAAHSAPILDPAWREATDARRMDRKTKHSSSFEIDDGWKGKLELRLDGDRADASRAKRVGFVNSFSLLDAAGWNLGVSGGVQSRFSGSRPYVLTFGPKVEYDAGAYGLELSSTFEEKFGRGAPTLEMEYEADVVRRHRGLDLGFRFAGELEAVDRGAPMDGQEHQAGPFGELELVTANGERLELKLGAMVGLTELSDDLGVKWEVKVSFGP